MSGGRGRVTEASCRHCTAPFERKIADIKLGKGLYCSTPCAGAARHAEAQVTLTCSHTACGRDFRRILSDMLGAKTVFCSKACQLDAKRGRTFQEYFCSTCFRPYLRLPAQARRRGQQFCSRPCYFVTIDRAALGRAGALSQNRAAIPPLVRFRRSQKAGFARARNLSKQRLHEIAMMAVAARRAKGAGRPGQRRDLPRKAKRGMQFIGPLLALTKETA